MKHLKDNKCLLVSNWQFTRGSIEAIIKTKDVYKRISLNFTWKNTASQSEEENKLSGDVVDDLG